MPQQPTDERVAEWIDEGGGGDPRRARTPDDWRPAVLANAVSKLNAWCAWLAELDPAVDLVDATGRHLKDYLAARRTAGIGPATRRKDWQMIRAFYAWAATPGRHRGGSLLADDPMVDVPGPYVSQTPSTRAARPDEIAKIEDHLEATARQRRGGGEQERARRNLAMVSLMFRSGCRSCDLPPMNLADVDTSRGDGRWVIHLRGDDTKNAEPRVIPVLPETERYLRRYFRLRGTHAGPLFLGRAAHTRALDGRLTATAVQRVIKRAADAVGAPVSSHQLRRGFVVEQFTAGADTTMVQVVGGWRDPRMPHRYLADQRSAVATERFFALHEQPSRRARPA
jgi:integrase